MALDYIQLKAELNTYITGITTLQIVWKRCAVSTLQPKLMQTN